MKKTILVLGLSLITAVATTSCNDSNQDKAIKQANEIQSATKPGTVATTADGYSMKANIDGKGWTAASMMPPAAAGRIVGYYNDEYIGLPYSQNDMVAGKKIMIGEDNAVDFSMNNDCLYTSPKGEIEIIKVDDGWAEGKFFFSVVCSSTAKVVEVTGGSFRITLSKNQ